MPEDKQIPSHARPFLEATIAGFQVVSYLGSGATADVFLATKDGTPIALKIFRDWVIQASHGRERVGRSVEAIQKIDHPNVCKIYDGGIAMVGVREIDFVAMELIEGRELTDVIPAEGLSWSELQPLAIALTSAVQALHAQELVHRDIKPANIMVTNAGRVVLVDFGVVTDLQAAEPQLTESHKFLGTIRYGAPEVGK